MKSKFFGIWVLLVVFSIGIPSVCYGGEIVLMFPKLEAKEKARMEGRVFLSKESDYTETKLLEFVRKFEERNYKVDQIELWIEAKVESGNVTKLFISLGATGGCKVILKPRK